MNIYINIIKCCYSGCFKQLCDVLSVGFSNTLRFEQYGCHFADYSFLIALYNDWTWIVTHNLNNITDILQTPFSSAFFFNWKIYYCFCSDLTEVCSWGSNWQYPQIFNIKCTKIKCFLSRLAVHFAQSIEARCSVQNEDVVGAALPGDAPTTSEWSTVLLPAKVWLILEVWW